VFIVILFLTLREFIKTNVIIEKKIKELELEANNIDNTYDLQLFFNNKVYNFRKSLIKQSHHIRLNCLYNKLKNKQYE
jgi:hypothetical protein